MSGAPGKTAGVLAHLLAQGEGAGADMATLRAIAEEAGELGATRALTRLGLADEAATGDVAELRELLHAWRDAKRSAWKAVAGWVARLLAMLLLAGHSGAPVGEARVMEDARGLLVEACASVPVRVGEGLSVGFRATAARQGAWRELLGAELVEVSLVRQPMQPAARVLRVGVVAAADT